MMKTRVILSLLIVGLTACSSMSTQTQAAAPASATPNIVNPNAVMDLTATPAPTVQMVVTSRGPHLEATDPKTVRMASGGLQFVEFFEFW
jgi:ABC-type Fe3+-hydroxamate transport system substrate-binding protein